MRRYEQRGLWPHHAGARGGRLGTALVRVGSKCAFDVCDLCKRQRGTEAALLAGDGEGKIDRMLRADGTRPRLGPRRDGNAGAARRRRMDSQRNQAMDHQRLDRRRRDCVGEGRRRHNRVPGREGDAGILDPRHPRKIFDARVDHLGTDFRRRANSEDGASRESARAEGSARMPDAGALWNRVGRDWRGAIVFPLRARLHEIAQAILASARGLSTGAGEAGEDADRDHQGADGLPAPRASEGRRARCAPSTCRSPSGTTSTRR